MERWSIEIQKEYFKFSAAHFLIFPDGTAERLHGHNYRVFVEIDASLSRHGLVIDFKRVKPLVRELVDELVTVEESELTEAMVKALENIGKKVEYHLIDSSYGHDAFLLEHETFAPMLRAFLDRIGAGSW